MIVLCGTIVRLRIAHYFQISSRLNKPFVFADEPLIVQYEVQLQVRIVIRSCLRFFLI